MSASRDDVEQLRQDHPGTAAHLPGDEAVLRPLVEQAVAGVVHVASEAAAAVDAVLAALRARRAQDTPSDPAAWKVGDRVLDRDQPESGPGTVESVSPGAAVIRWDSGSRTEQGGLDLVRAPGAVAAAPTEDARLTDAVEFFRDLPESYSEGEYQDNLRTLLARLVPPAPSAGEDEAAVERVKRLLVQALPVNPSDADFDTLARAALAAARGPRTQDGQS